MINKIQKKLVIHPIEEMRAYAAEAKTRGERIGLVPTMGSLHEGHLSLIRRAGSESDLVIVSIFVNPIQFDDPADLSAYPKKLHSDAEKAFSVGADVIFAPEAREMYPQGFSTYIDMTGIANQLCGAVRQSHFRGVCTVVGKLFGICRPDTAWFGEKDAQQLAIVRKMTDELCLNVKIIGCPTVRETDGLAMSSRNARLADDERIAARCLYRAITETKARFVAGEKDPKVLSAALRATLENEPLARIDYIEIADPDTFEAVSDADPVHTGDLIMLAVYIGNTRLIDNGRF